MRARDRTIVLIDKSLALQPSDFAILWNAAAGRENLPVASSAPREKMFNGDLMQIVGDAANVIQIATFIGLPTIAGMIEQLIKRHKLRRNDTLHTSDISYEETIIDLGLDGRVKRIVIRRKNG